MALSDAIDEYHSDIGVIPVVVCPDTPENTIKSTRTIDPSHLDNKQTPWVLPLANGSAMATPHSRQSLGLINCFDTHVAAILVIIS